MTRPASWAIIDLDGTLSDCRGRVQYAMAARHATSPEDRDKWWAQFHGYCQNDPPHRAEVLLVQAWVAAGNRIVYLTGRPATHRGMTQRWFRQLGLPETPLIMREPGDFTTTVEYKRAQYELITKTLMAPGDILEFVMEDQERLVAMWRGLGVTCLQPRPGAF